jgi:PIN domain nuclease of toxin-antitoxin system
MLIAPERLSRRGHAVVTAPDNELLLSAGSAWEIAIKHALGKLTTPEPPDVFVPRLMTRLGITPLPVLHRHALHVATLPPRHRDPFDRLLVAQAQLEGLPILTADRGLGLYDVDVLPA